MNSLKLANALGKNIKKYSITSFSIDFEKRTVGAFWCSMVKII